MTPFQERLQGVIPALLTPLNPQFSADTVALRHLVRRVIDAGCHGFVLLGTTGEFASIDDKERSRVIQTAVDEAANTVPVIVACGQPNVRRVHEQAQAAANLGADGLLVNPPFYFPMSNDEVVRYFEGVVNASPAPVLLYNIPSMTKVSVDAPTLIRLRDVGVQGTKDSSGNPQNLLAYLNATRTDDFRVIVGGDSQLLHALLSGASGTTGPAPNVAPQLVLDIYNAWRDGNLATAATAQNVQNEFLQAMASVSSDFLAVAKGVLSRVGVMDRWMAPPRTSLDDTSIDRTFEAVRIYLPEHRPAVAAK